MQTPKPSQGSDTLIKLGKWHGAALDQFDETRPLVAAFLKVVQTLIAARGKVSDAEDALIPIRMALMLGELNLEKEMRRLNGACQAVDGKRRGPTATACYPKGMKPALVPVGQGQVDEAAALLIRTKERGLNTHEKLADNLTAIGGARDVLQTRVDARKTAYETLAAAKAAEGLAREDFCSAYVRQAGLIKSIFPDDRQLQELFFDTFRKSPSTASEDEGGGTVGGGTGGEGGGTGT
jgi:hypothetical protein